MPTLIMFRSLTYAQRGARALERGGIHATVTKAPQGTSDRGCTYCVKIPDGRLYRALDLLDAEGVARGRVLRSAGDGEYREVLR